MSEDAEEVAPASSAVVVESHHDSITLPVGSSIDTIALASTESMRIADGVIVESFDNSPFGVVNTGEGTLELGSHTTLGDQVGTVSVLAKETLYLREYAHVRGNIHAEGQLQTQSHWTIDGAQIVSTPLPMKTPLEWDVDFERSSSHVSLEPDQTQVLAPGAYGSLTVKPRARVKLSSGRYFFENIDAHSSSSLEVTGNDGPVLLFVRSGATFRGAIAGTDAEKRLLLAGVGNSMIHVDAPFKGTVFAPAAPVRVGPADGSGHDGSFFGKTLEVEARQPVRFVPFEYWGYLFPPKVTAECLSRAKVTHAAGLFTFDNPLENTTRIPEGPMNQLSASIIRNEPLQVFAPGEHTKMYWVQFGGAQLTWTLLGASTTIDSGTRHCERTDYLQVPADHASAGGAGLPVVPEEFCTGTCAPDLQSVAPASIPSFFPKPPEYTHPRGMRLQTSDTGLGGDGIGGAEGYFFWRLFRINSVSEAMARGETDWDPHNAPPANSGLYGEYGLNLDPGKGNGEPWLCSIPDSHTCPDNTYTGVLEDGESLLYFSLSDQPDDFFGGWDHEVQGWVRIDTAAGTVTLLGLFDNDWVPLTPTNCLGSTDLNACFCGRKGDYHSCFAPSIDPPASERLCADWRVQYVDGGYGEDDLSPTSPSFVPASFASVRLISTSSTVTGWSTFYPLDAEGCIPAKFSPRQDVAAAARLVDPNALSLEVMGFLFDPDTTTKLKIVDDSGSTFSVIARHDPTTGRYRSQALDELTRSAGGASHLAKLHASGRDMGLQGGVLEINGRSSAAVSSGTAFARGSTVNLRPASTIVSDSALKDVWAHELGHAVQSRALGGTMFSFSYETRMFDAAGVEVAADFPALPQECRCDSIQEEFSTLHCMQSVETLNAAQVEGFASAYALRALNEPAENDCWLAYVKWTLFPGCPTYADPLANNAVQCVDILAMTPAELTQFGIDNNIRTLPDVDELRASGLPWVMLKPPVILDCATAARWKATRCIDPSVATADLREFGGTELDWTQFFWALTASGAPTVAGSPWTMSDALRPYQAICGTTGTGCSTEMTWDTLTTAVNDLTVSSVLTDQQQLRFEDSGLSRGVSPL